MTCEFLIPADGQRQTWDEMTAVQHTPSPNPVPAKVPGLRTCVTAARLVTRLISEEVSHSDPGRVVGRGWSGHRPRWMKWVRLVRRLGVHRSANTAAASSARAEGVVPDAELGSMSGSVTWSKSCTVVPRRAARMVAPIRPRLEPMPAAAAVGARTDPRGWDRPCPDRRTNWRAGRSPRDCRRSNYLTLRERSLCGAPGRRPRVSRAVSAPRTGR